MGKVTSLVKHVLTRDWVVKAAGHWSANSLVVLAYHRVKRRGEVSPLADSLFGADEEGFAGQIAWLARHTSPMSETDVLDCIAQAKPFPNRATLVTFDDGYRDTFTIAAPILKRYGVPAIYFIPTAPISRREPFWWDEIAWLLKRTTADHVRVNGRSFDFSPAHRPQVIDSVITWFKRSDAQTRRTLMQDLKRGAGAPGMPPEMADSALMTLQQVLSLREYGISVGCHTVNHPALSHLDPEAQERELRESKAQLESWLGREVISVAYPFGGSEHFTEETKAIAQKVGFRLGFVLTGEGNRTGQLHPLAIDRIHPPEEVESFVLRLSMPQLMRLRQRM